LRTEFENENHQLDVRDLMIRNSKTKTNCFDVHDLMGKGNRVFENAGQATCNPGTGSKHFSFTKHGKKAMRKACDV
jgi:hypothetical protein